MIDERDDLLKEIGAALQIEASPEFAARVRMRVGEEPSAWSFGKWLAIAGGAAACAIVAVALVRQDAGTASPIASVADAASRTTVPPIAPAGTTSRSTSAASGTPFESSPAVTRVPTAHVDASARTTRLAPAERGRRVEPTAVTPAPAPDLQVLTNQADVLRRVWQAASRAAVDAKEADRSFRNALGRLAEFSPVAVTEIRIAPIVMPDIESSSDTTRGPRPDGRVKAEQSARSSE